MHNIQEYTALTDQNLYYETAWKGLVIEGADASDFLNRLLSLRISSLELGQSSLAFLLDHRGSVREAFYLIRTHQDRFIAVSETGAESLYEALDFYFFAESLSLTVAANQTYIYMSALHELPQTVQFNLYPIDFLGRGNEALICLSESECKRFFSESEPFSFPTLQLNSAEFDALRIAWGAAHPQREYLKQSPLNVSLKGVSEGKGCYPGQEVIERTIAIGKPARKTIPLIIKSSFSTLESLVKLFQSLTTLKLMGQSLNEVDSNQTQIKEMKEIGLLSSLSSLPTRIAEQAEFETHNREAPSYLLALGQVKFGFDPTLSIALLLDDPNLALDDIVIQTRSVPTK